MSGLEGFTAEEILHETLIMPRSALHLLPGARIIERPGFWQLVTPALRTGGMNEVGTCILDPNADVDAVIDAAIGEYRSLGIQFRWNVVPGSRPIDLGERLKARGLEEVPVRAMAASTQGHQLRPLEARVERVDQSNVAEFTQVTAQGWGMDPAPARPLHQRMLADPRNQLYLAREGREPAGVASFVAFPRSAYLIGGVVLPKFRHRGLFQAIVDAMLHDLAVRGIPLATTVAIESTSAPIVERLGFHTIARFSEYMG
ncbi:MAG: GNAT family N-acetyltransferase [Myxococcota bacterium]